MFYITIESIYYIYIAGPCMAMKIIAAIIGLHIITNLHIFGTRQVIAGVCLYTSTSSQFYWMNVHDWISITIYCLIPVLTMTTLNGFIIARLRRLKKQINGGAVAKISSMTIMLLTITVYFVVVTTPIFIYTLYQRVHVDRYNQTAYSQVKLEMIDAVLTLMLYMNHAVNFFLYCLTGRRFRQEFLALGKETVSRKANLCQKRKKLSMEASTRGMVTSFNSGQSTDPTPADS